MQTSRFRWLAVAAFVISSVLNYLDRALLAALAPMIMGEFHLNNTKFGLLVSAFSLPYAVATLASGWFLDSAGLDIAMSSAIAWWSTSAICTALTRGFGGLALCRASLGIGESAGVPGFGKLNGTYLKPEERALGAAANQIGLSLGLALAPMLIPVAQAYGWRTPFVATGLAGLLWIPLWLGTSRAVPCNFKPVQAAQSIWDRNLLVLVTATVLWMTSYSLWSNWTTLYLVNAHQLSLAQSKSYAAIPPLISNLGGFFGGWLSLRWMRKHHNAVRARCAAIWVSAAGSLLALMLPLAASPGWATALISASFFFSLAGSVNLYALPIDLYGAQRAGMSIAVLTCAFGLMQMVLSPVIGALADHGLYAAVVWIATVPLLLSAITLTRLRSS